MALQARQQAPRGLIMQKFYIYDSGVSANDEVGGMRVRGDDDKGLYVLAPSFAMQYWIDQGLLGLKPLGEVSGVGKKLLAQITRGRSTNPDVDPARVPRYDRSVQSGAPMFAGLTPAAMRKKAKTALKKKGGPTKASPPAPKPTAPKA